MNEDEMRAAIDAAYQQGRDDVRARVLELAEELEDRGIKAIVEGHYWPEGSSRRNQCAGKSTGYRVAADEMRETLARTLGEAWITSGPRAWDEQSEARRQGARHLADALLPVVRKIAADELRAAGQPLRLQLRQGGAMKATTTYENNGGLYDEADE